MLFIVSAITYEFEFRYESLSLSFDMTFGNVIRCRLTAGHWQIT